MKIFYDGRVHRCHPLNGHRGYMNSFLVLFTANSSNNDSQQNSDAQNNNLDADSSPNASSAQSSSSGNSSSGNRRGNNSNSRPSAVQRRPNVNGPFQHYRQKNLSGSLVTRKLVNTSLISNPQTLSEQVEIILEFKISIDKSQLIQQAFTWATRVNLQNELDLYKVLGSNQAFYVQRLAEIYVYSYFKSLLYGFYRRSVTEMQDGNFVLAGHSILYGFCDKRIIQHTLQNVFISYKLVMTDEEINSIIDMANTFNFINGRISRFAGSFSICNTTIDRRLNQLKTMFRGKSTILIDLTNRSYIAENLTLGKFPLANSFLSKNGKKFYYCYNDLESINGNVLLFGKACFLTVSSIANRELNCFESNPTFNTNQLTKYEVSCIASDKYFDVPISDFIEDTADEEDDPEGKS